MRSSSRRIKRRGDFLFCGRCGIDAGYGGSGLTADATVGICERFRQCGDGRFGLRTELAQSNRRVLADVTVSTLEALDESRHS